MSTNVNNVSGQDVEEPVNPHAINISQFHTPTLALVESEPPTHIPTLLMTEEIVPVGQVQCPVSSESSLSPMADEIDAFKSGFHSSPDKNGDADSDKSEDAVGPSSAKIARNNEHTSMPLDSFVPPLPGSVLDLVSPSAPEQDPLQVSIPVTISPPSQVYSPTSPAPSGSGTPPLPTSEAPPAWFLDWQRSNSQNLQTQFAQQQQYLLQMVHTQQQQQAQQLQQQNLDLLQKMAADRAADAQKFMAISAAHVQQYIETHDKSMQDLAAQFTKMLNDNSNKQKTVVDSISSRLDAITSRLDVVEAGPSGSSGDTQSGERISSSPPSRKNRFLKPPTPGFQPQSGLLSTKPSKVDSEASKPNCLRMKGFKNGYVKKDLLKLSEDFIEYKGIDRSKIVEIHASATAKSSVFEFQTKIDANKAFQLSKQKPLTWTDPVTKLKHDLFLSRIESAEERAVGLAIHQLWNSAALHVLPNCPKDSKLSGDKNSGVLKIAVSDRWYDLLQIEFAQSLDTFKLVVKKGPLASPILPDCINQGMIDSIVKDCFSDGILAIDAY